LLEFTCSARDSFFGGKLNANDASFAIRKMFKEDSALEWFAYDLPRFAINPVELVG